MSAEPVVLAIDVGGSHVKIQTSDGGQSRRVVSGPKMDSAAMCAAVLQLADGLNYDVISIGYPGPVTHDKPLAEPHNLAAGWVGFDYAGKLGKPVKIVNDAMMQAIGSYEGGRMLFLGLGTGLGAAMLVDGIAQPMELAHLPYKKKTFEDYVGDARRQKKGDKEWEAAVFDVVDRLSSALEPDYVVLGGGNAARLSKLPPKCKLGSNANAFAGGFKLWQADTPKTN